MEWNWYIKMQYTKAYVCMHVLYGLSVLPTSRDEHPTYLKPYFAASPINCAHKSRLRRVAHGHHTAWTPQQLHNDPDAFISEMKISLPLRPSITMHYLFVSPKTACQTVGGPIISVRRSYTMHHRSSTKKIVSFTKLPFDALYSGVFFSRTEARNYGEVFRTQGLSFAAEGVARARECMASDVERAKEVGDTLSVHTCLLPLALISGVNGDSAIALGAALDAARVTRSAAARHRSLMSLCDSIRCILRMFIGWLQATEPILVWEEDTVVDEGPDVDKNAPDGDEGRWNPKRRCRSAKDLLQTWLRRVNLLFWGWRRNILLYLDADQHSDVAVMKDKVRSWIGDVSSTARMGLRLPMLRWHDHGRSIAEGRGAFLDASASICQRLDCLSGWLHCLDLSLSWDAARVCERVHTQHHLLSQSKNNANSTAHAGHWPHLMGHKTQVVHQERSNSGTLPTAGGLLLLQRAWLDDAAVGAYVRENEAIGKGRGRTNHRHGKVAAAATATAVEAALAKGIRYHPAPVAPDSAQTLEGLDVRLAVITTLRKDAFPEAIAHEVTLMKYITDSRIDLSLNDSIAELLSSVLAPNPFPALTASLALASMAHVLHSVGVDTTNRLPALVRCVNSKVSGERSPSRGTNNDYFAVRGTEVGTAVFGSKPALLGVNADFALSLFRAIPPIASWVLDESGREGDDSVGVAVGISGCAQQHGSHTYPTVPTELNIVVACVYGYDLRTGATPAEKLSCLAVYCAVTAHETSPLLVIGLAVATHTDENLPSSRPGILEDRYPLNEILASPQEIEDDISQVEPDEIVLEALMLYHISNGGGALIPLSIRFVLTSNTDVEHGVEDGDPAEATLLYDCAYSTASAAKHLSTRNSALLESGSAARHVQHTRRLVLESADRLNYLEAYRLFHHLRDLQLLVPDDIGTPIASGTNTDDAKMWPHKARDGSPERAEHSRGDDASVTAAILRMLRGPAGRLYHARRLLEVLRRVVARDDLPPETLVFLDERTVKDHAEYSINYLLDALAEQPMVRFEGAVKSVKLRARLLLDHVAKMTESEGSSGASSPQMAGANATAEAASKLADSVVAILRILQAAVEADTHRCHPEVEKAFGRLREADKREGQAQYAFRAGRRAGEPPKREKGGRVAGGHGQRGVELTNESGSYKTSSGRSSGGVDVQPK